MIECVNGHFYDRSQNHACPFCDHGPVDLSDDGGIDRPRNFEASRARQRSEAFNLRVFISSTFEDLQEYRAAAFAAIQSLGAHNDDMIHWAADERSAATFSIDRIKACDVVILMVAHRYSSLPIKEGISITEMEYDAARREGIPVLAFFIDEDEPWPPKWMDASNADRLKRFKQKVEAEVTRKTFHSPDDLARLVTQALAMFIGKHRDYLDKRRRFEGMSVRVSEAQTCRTQPDTVVPIGLSEAGLPLLLRLKRSRDLGPSLHSLAEQVGVASFSLDALISMFRQSLEANARTTWATERIVPVLDGDGGSNELYVSQLTLTRLFRSTFDLLLSEAGQVAPGGDATYGRTDDDERTRSVWQSVDAPVALQSEGGRNRFLGIDPESGYCYSVGKVDGRWLEWRSFLPESILDTFPNARFVSDHHALSKGHLSELPRSLLDFFVSQHVEDSLLPLKVSIAVSRQDVAVLIARIAHRLAEMHASHRLHGDLKPANILCCGSGVQLIDSFDVAEGDVWPGWTPNWSSPEQVLGEPATAASDLYPIGRMIARLLGGELVGEVRKFKASPAGRGIAEFDIFYNPSVYVSEGSAVAMGGGLAAWRGLARDCLRFAPRERPQSAAELAARIVRLTEEFPLRGTVMIPIAGELHLATLVDGTIAVASVLDDGAPSGRPSAESSWTMR